MNELSLFSGAGGGLLGTKLLGFRCVGYVEWEPYCQAVLAQRIADGFLEEAPIFGDIREFVKSGAAREYRGFADVVTGGFPCQPFSQAGRQRAEDDPRNMWPATADVLREVRPRFALLENVPGLLTTGYCERIFGDLASLGFDARWGVLSAAGSGAPHLRERFFIVANAPEQFSDGGVNYSGNRLGGALFPNLETVVGRRMWPTPAASERGGATVPRISPLPHKSGERMEQERFTNMADPDSAGFTNRAGGGTFDERIGNGTADRPSCWDRDPAEISSESGMGRMADGVACRVDRLKAIGNGQVPSVVVRAWTELTR